MLQSINYVGINLIFNLKFTLILKLQRLFISLCHLLYSEARNMKYRNIEIDLELHKLLEFNRKNFDESECEILRRMFVDKERRNNMAPLSANHKAGATVVESKSKISPGQIVA